MRRLGITITSKPFFSVKFSIAGVSAACKGDVQKNARSAHVMLILLSIYQPKILPRTPRSLSFTSGVSPSVTGLFSTLFFWMRSASFFAFTRVSFLSLFAVTLLHQLASSCFSCASIFCWVSTSRTVGSALSAPIFFRNPDSLDADFLLPFLAVAEGSSSESTGVTAVSASPSLSSKVFSSAFVLLLGFIFAGVPVIIHLACLSAGTTVGDSALAEGERRLNCGGTESGGRDTTRNSSGALRPMPKVSFIVPPPQAVRERRLQVVNNMDSFAESFIRNP